MVKTGEEAGKGLKRRFWSLSARRKRTTVAHLLTDAQDDTSWATCRGCAAVYLFVGEPMGTCPQCSNTLIIQDEPLPGAGAKRIVTSWTKGQPATMARSAGKAVSRFMDSSGLVDVDQVAKTFGMSKGQLAATTGLATATLSKTDRRAGVRAQSRVTEMLEIISRIMEWAGGEAQAMAWYRSQPIPALDGRTPEALVKSGRAASVRDYLDHLALGGFA